MTAFGVRRVVEQLREAGRFDAVVVCPVCGGGSRKRRTLSVNRRDGVWLWVCHRGTCNVRGAMVDGESIGRSGPDRTFTPRPMEWPLRYADQTTPVGKKIRPLLEHGDIVDFSVRHGLYVHAFDPGTHIWACKDVDGLLRGHVSRDESKNILSWRMDPSPFYATFIPDGARDFDYGLVVEDPLSAALAAESGAFGIALLGTNLPVPLAGVLARWSKATNMPLVVALDPDEAGVRAQKTAVDRLRAFGAETHGACLYTDLKNMTREARDRWVEAWAP